MDNNLFKKPPAEYGEVPFFWWHGDDITKEKLSWILEQLKDSHICGLQINYCHSDKGGCQWGLTMESNPHPFSEEWWELVGWFIKECKKYGISVSLSDYTLGAPGQESYADWVLAAHPEFIGQKLVWEDGEVKVEKVPYSMNPMCKGLGEAVINEFYGAFERHYPGECGKGINYFFSDELNFNVRGNLWCDDFKEEFLARKGYDITEKWNAIFQDIGPETPKIRMDYRDVIVSLSEEGYFKPVYNWHEERGMVFGCDHGGRGRDVTEFGDYFRTMKWHQGPGNDQPRLASDIIKSKASSSICHLYQRKRVWLEGFYSSGWQTTAGDVADAVFRNLGLGHTLLSLHGLYYSTHGSMWEWAPPCNHYHMPYWTEMKKLLECTKRMSWALSQGVHRCDVAIVYPVAAMEADEERGKQSVACAFEIAEYLYRKGIDFDFIDFESIQNAVIEECKLCVAGEQYRTVVVPDMKAVRFGMAEKLSDFADKGGQVLFLGDMPSESDRVGREDEQLEYFCKRWKLQGCHVGTAQTKGYEEVLKRIDESYDRDFSGENEDIYFLHRHMDGREYYYVYGAKKGSLLKFRATGVPVLWNPWTGEPSRLSKYRTIKGLHGEDIAEIIWEGTEKEICFIGFETEEAMKLPCTVFDKNVLKMEGLWDCTLEPTMDNRYGDYRLPPSEEMIGAEGRRFRYCQTEEMCAIPSYDDSGWETGTYSFGIYFYIAEGPQDEEKLITAKQVPDGFSPYRFSMECGIEGDAGYQGSYHGLKGKISDDFLGLGRKRVIRAGSSSEYEGEGPYYLFTKLWVEGDGIFQICCGETHPESIWIDHEVIRTDRISLAQGGHVLLLKYKTGCRTHFVLKKEGGAFKQTKELATQWYENPDMVTFDAMPEQAEKLCWYRFQTPPGLKEIQIKGAGNMRLWVDGTEWKKEGDCFRAEKTCRLSSVAAVCLKQPRGTYETAAIKEPFRFVCEEGVLDASIPIEQQGLEFYSGGIRLKKNIEIESLEKPIALNLGTDQYTAAVWVNGEFVDYLVAAPFSCDITRYLKIGVNEIEVLLHNSLYNHMKTIPTNYNGKESIGCLGPNASR